jgi:DNA replication and repair protein RecF
VWLGSIEVKNFRIIEQLKLEPEKRFNWIIGPNGAGKTSLLEAICYLARGKSFRSSRHGNIQRRDSDSLRVKGVVYDHGARTFVEITVGSQRKKLSVNGAQIRRIGDLREKLHVRVLSENSQRLLEDEPALRRLFVDWNLFHVEQHYPRSYASFRRALKQRNIWLRSGGKGRNVWDEQLVEYADAVATSRQQFAVRLDDELRNLQLHHPFFPSISVNMNRGWPCDIGLREALASTITRDIHRGYTGMGPSRAEIEFAVGGQTGLGSRGQTKVAVVMLQIAAQRVCEQLTQNSCIWLLDDLKAELDSLAFEGVWRVFAESNYQVFATGREIVDAKCLIGNSGEDLQVFHVEQGKLMS